MRERVIFGGRAAILFPRGPTRVHTASPPKQEHSRAKSRQLTGYGIFRPKRKINGILILRPSETNEKSEKKLSRFAILMTHGCVASRSIFRYVFFSLDRKLKENKVPVVEL